MNQRKRGVALRELRCFANSTSTRCIALLENDTIQAGESVSPVKASSGGRQARCRIGKEGVHGHHRCRQASRLRNRVAEPVRAIDWTFLLEAENKLGVTFAQSISYPNCVPRSGRRGHSRRRDSFSWAQYLAVGSCFWCLRIVVLLPPCRLAPPTATALSAFNYISLHFHQVSRSRELQWHQ